MCPARHNQLLELFTGGDQGSGHGEGVSGMDVFSASPVHQQEPALQFVRDLDIGLAVGFGGAKLAAIFVDLVGDIIAAVMTSSNRHANRKDIWIVKEGARGGLPATGHAVDTG